MKNLLAKTCLGIARRTKKSTKRLGRKNVMKSIMKAVLPRCPAFFFSQRHLGSYLYVILQLQLVTYILLQKVLYSSVYKKSLDIWTFLCKANDCRGCDCPAF